MTNEEAIEILQEEHNWVKEPCYVINAIKKAIDALQFSNKCDKNETEMRADRDLGDPLTLKQLREMVDKPAYLYIYDTALDSGWHIIKAVTDDKIIFHGRNAAYVPVSSLGKCFDLYTYYPAHIYREAWEPCEYCKGKTVLYQRTVSTKLFMNTFGSAATLVTECENCPPYADCCMKGISANSVFRIKFCPECGRPLTEESWNELKNRFRNIKL